MARPPSTRTVTPHITDSRQERSFKMELYAIIRRGGWSTSDELAAAAARSTATGEEMADEVRWIRRYVLDEAGGALGTVCIYEATSPEAVRTHAVRAVIPLDEIVPIADTVVVRPDPDPVTH
ncbi:MAG: nickel-binding protein [Solirubrobacteraceae bacterium]